MSTDLITSLRPKGTTAQHIRDSLNLAIVAQTDLTAAVRRSQQERDMLLLDGSPTAMAKADTALAAARELRDKVDALTAQLNSRLAAAEETETMAQLDVLRVEAEAKERALATWWLQQRQKLASELTTGVSLLTTAEVAYRNHAAAVATATERYPTQVFQPAQPAEVDAHSWPFDLAECARMVDAFPTAFEALLTSGDVTPVPH